MSADGILLNGRIETLAGQRATALAWTGEQILAVGSDDEIRALRGKTTEVVDLRGRLVLPAFSDAHTHFAAYALNRSRVDLKGVDSLAEAGRRVGEAAERSSSDSWILGRGWLHDLWGGDLPSKELLDAAAPGRPVALARGDGHGLWVSSEALTRAGIGRDTADPSGGKILRDAAGEPTGVLSERAMDLVYRIIPPSTHAEMAEAIRAALPIAHAAGLGSVTCMEDFAVYRVYRSLAERGELSLRVGMCLAVDDFDEEIDLVEREGRGDARLHWTQLKIFSDGALNPRTAWMLEPYADDPSNVGICVTPADELRRLAERSARAGFACAVHAIGDAANRVVLDAFEVTHPLWASQGLRPRIEHAQTVAPVDVSRFGRLGVIASMQPIHCTQDMFVADKALGRVARTAYPIRSLLNGGARLAFGSDTPVETFDVLQGLYAATTRRRADGTPPEGWYSEERLALPDAVAAYTRGAAFAEYEEGRKGTLEPGKLADLVVLSEDIFAEPPEVLLRTRVIGTVVGGCWVYRTE